MTALEKTFRMQIANGYCQKPAPLPGKYFRDPVTLSENFDSVKKAYIFCTGGGDNIDEILKEKLDGPARVIESGHWSMITKPEDLVEDILTIIS